MRTNHETFVAAQANLRSKLSRASGGRSHNEWGFSNRMLDTTVALMGAK
jgi:glyceraldehyde-3-phosphate dehydrogenase/erythrose-4-phosphate dehydrogenase